MNKVFIFGSAILALVSGSPAAQDVFCCDVAEDYARHVDVFTGTAATGHTTPAAACPFGMVQAGPDTGNHDWAYCSGYQYHDQAVIGYSQTHLSGTGGTDMGDVQILPFTGTFSARPAYRAVDKSRECGEPGNYAIVQGIDTYSHLGEDFARMFASDGWQVALLASGPRFGKLSLIERHVASDEEFVLLSGAATLYCGEEAKSFPMEVGKVYNLRKGSWHGYTTPRTQESTCQHGLRSGCCDG